MRRAVLASIAVAVFLAGCSLEGVGVGETAQELPDPSPSVTFDQADTPPPHSDLADMVEEVLPSVVNIRVEAVSFDPLGEAQIGKGEGSGVVIDPSGIIITNNHVIADATDVQVVFNDGTKLDGTVLGTSPENDVAVVQVEADEPLAAIEIGDSSSLRLGDDVVAIGFPLGLGGSTVTKGIISALDRTIDIRQEDPSLPPSLQGLLQTDAAINPGNSGGALVDAAGRLVGINTAAAQAGAAENIGFAIPIDTALPIAQEIVEKPPEQRSYLGVQIQELTPPVAAQLGIDPDLEGALVAGLFPDGPAEDAGIEQGDVIVEIAGEAITGIQDVNTALRDLNPGELVEVVVVRGSDEMTIEVELGRRPTTFAD